LILLARVDIQKRNAQDAECMQAEDDHGDAANARDHVADLVIVQHAADERRRAAEAEHDHDRESEHEQQRMHEGLEARGETD